jgi:hypothetical protein
MDPDAAPGSSGPFRLDERIARGEKGLVPGCLFDVAVGILGAGAGADEQNRQGRRQSKTAPIA